MNRYSYSAILEPSTEGGYVVTFRDLPEAITQGESFEESLAEASDCLAEAIAARIDDGREIPEPSEMQTGEERVAVPLHIALKAALYLALKETGIAKTQLGEMLGKDEKEIRRILDPHHGTKLPTIEQALRALGKWPELYLH
jgi:antitoxin HicB